MFGAVSTLGWAKPPYAGRNHDVVTWECSNCYSLAVRCEQHSIDCESRNVNISQTVPIAATDGVAGKVESNHDDLSRRLGD